MAQENNKLPLMTADQIEIFNIFTEQFPANGINEFLWSYKGYFGSHEDFAFRFWHETIAPDAQIPIWAIDFVDWNKVWEMKLKDRCTEINGYYFDNDYCSKK